MLRDERLADLTYMRTHAWAADVKVAEVSSRSPTRMTSQVCCHFAQALWDSSFQCKTWRLASSDQHAECQLLDAYATLLLLVQECMSLTVAKTAVSD